MKPIGRPAPQYLDEKIVKGIDGLQMLDNWRLGVETGRERILVAEVEG